MKQIITGLNDAMDQSQSILNFPSHFHVSTSGEHYFDQYMQYVYYIYLKIESHLTSLYFAISKPFTVFVEHSIYTCYSPNDTIPTIKHVVLLHFLHFE